MLNSIVSSLGCVLLHHRIASFNLATPYHYSSLIIAVEFASTDRCTPLPLVNPTSLCYLHDSLVIPSPIIVLPRAHLLSCPVCLSHVVSKESKGTNQSQHPLTH
jgi:hypothetical protein